MKKATKIILITAAICVALGFAISIVTVLAGGFEIAEEVVFGKRMPSLFVKADRKAGDFGVYFGSASGEEQSMGWSADTIRNLDLEYEAGLVEIVEGRDDTMIKVCYRGKNTISLEGNNLIVNATDKDFIDAKGTIRIEVPENFTFENVEMQLGASQTNIEELKTKNFDMQLGAGAACIEEIVCDDMSVEIAAGEVVVEEAMVGDASIDVGMGNFEYEGIVKKDLDVNCGMGNVYFELDEDEASNNYKLECGAGNITVGTMSYGCLATAKTITNENATTDYILKCGMGNVTIAFE